MDITTGLAPTQTVAGRVLTDLQNLIVLVASCSSGATSTFRKVGVAAINTGYTPSGGKAFKLIGIKAIGNVAGAGTIAQTDNDLAMNGAAVGTNVIAPNGLGAATLSNFQIGAGAPIETNFEPFTINNGKFLSMTTCSGSANCQVLAYGYEV